MGVLEWLGFGRAVEEETERTEVVARIGAALATLPRERARVLAAFAYLLGRVAHADHDLTPEETASMQAILIEFGNLTVDQATAVVALAQHDSLRHRGTEDFRVAQEFAGIASEDEKQALVRCLFALSASDEDVVVAEDNEIRRITQELKIPHADFVKARETVRDRLAVLKRQA